jgi:DNA-binding MarR family transcriptional regulator
VSRLDFKWDVTNDIEMSIFRIRKKLRTVVEKNLQPYGLTPPQFYILMILKKRGTARVTQLAQHMNVKPSAITVVTDRLVELEYVKRSHSEEDRRVVMLEMNENGVDIFNEVLAKHNAGMKEAFSIFDDSEISDLWLKLERLEKAADLAVAARE